MQRSAPKRVDLRHDRHPFACVGRPLPPSGRARAPGPLTVRWRDDTPPTPKGQRIALLFALAAERLNLYYAHGQWLTEAQGASLAADWLGRTKSRLPLAERRLLSSLSDQFERPCPVDLGPLASCFARGEPDQPALRIVLVELPVDPAVTQREIDRFSFAQARDACAFPGEPEPGPGRIIRLRTKPIAKPLRGLEQHDRQT